MVIAALPDAEPVAQLPSALHMAPTYNGVMEPLHPTQFLDRHVPRAEELQNVPKNVEQKNIQQPGFAGGHPPNY
jgi:hypothetical protein